MAGWKLWRIDKLQLNLNLKVLKMESSKASFFSLSNSCSFPFSRIFSIPHSRSQTSANLHLMLGWELDNSRLELFLSNHNL